MTSHPSNIFIDESNRLNVCFRCIITVPVNSIVGRFYKFPIKRGNRGYGTNKTFGLSSKIYNFQTYSPAILELKISVHEVPPSVVFKITAPELLPPHAKPMSSVKNLISTKVLA